MLVLAGLVHMLKYALMVRCPGEANYFRYYKRLGLFAKLATS
jgi:hypothetical protein